MNIMAELAELLISIADDEHLDLATARAALKEAAPAVAINSLDGILNKMQDMLNKAEESK